MKAVCAVSVSGRTLLASPGDDGTVRLWDPTTGQLERTLEGHDLWPWKPGRGGFVYALCPVSVGRRTLLAAAGDRTVLWDPATGQQERILRVTP